MASQLCKLFFRQNYVDVSTIIFPKCLPIRKKAENFLESNRRSSLKNHFPLFWTTYLILTNNDRGTQPSLESRTLRKTNKNRQRGIPIVVDQVKKILLQTLSLFAKSSRLSSRPNSIDFFAQVNIRSREEVRARVHVVGNLTHAQTAILANSNSVTFVVRSKKCETFS